MKKKFLMFLLSIFAFVTIGSTLTLDDLDISDKITVEAFLIEHIDEIPTGDVADLEGEEYELLAVGDDYVIVVVKGDIFIIWL